MADGIRARVRAIEKVVGAAASERREWSFAQLVLFATFKREHGNWPERPEALAGAPEDILQPGEKSAAEILREAVERARARREANEQGPLEGSLVDGTRATHGDLA